MNITGKLTEYSFVAKETGDKIDCYKVVYDLGPIGKVEVPIKKDKAQILLLAHSQNQSK